MKRRRPAATIAPMPDPQTLGADFARALAAKDFSRVQDLLHPEIGFRPV